jgi:hypothetical protein
MATNELDIHAQAAAVLAGMVQRQQETYDGLMSALANNGKQLELALEAVKTARRDAQKAEADFEAAKAEFMVEAMAAADGKNAETRKAQAEAMVLKAQRTGTLARSYGHMLNTKYRLEDAEMAYDQMRTRFRATEAAADLTAANYRAVWRWDGGV